MTSLVSEGQKISHDKQTGKRRQYGHTLAVIVDAAVLRRRSGSERRHSVATAPVSVLASNMNICTE